MTQEKWEVVIETFGLFDAQLIVGRLRTEGIPARAWSESAGRAFGITVGKLGTTYVEVPVQYIDQAQVIIDTDFSNELDEDAFEDAFEDDDESWDE